MKITDVETILLRLPVVREIGDGCQTICVIRVHTDEGIVGIGEAHTNPLAAQAVIDSPLYSVSAQGLKHVLIGEDPRDVNRLWDKMYKHTQTYGRRGLLMHALSGIDIALWDILGKSLGQPVYRLLGGARRKTHHAYASDLSQPTLEETIELALKHKEAGYRAMKFGWGALGKDRKSDIAVWSPRPRRRSRRGRRRATNSTISTSWIAASYASSSPTSRAWAASRRRCAWSPMPRRATCASSRIAGRPTSSWPRRCTAYRLCGTAPIWNTTSPTIRCARICWSIRSGRRAAR
jgi:hypothetical protein